MGGIILPERGLILPELSKPAGAAQILNGYQAIGQGGELITGTSPAKVLPSLSNPAAAADIRSGKQAISASGSRMIGSAEILEYITIRVTNNQVAQASIASADTYTVCEPNMVTTARVAKGQFFMMAVSGYTSFGFNEGNGAWREVLNKYSDATRYTTRVFIAYQNLTITI